MVISFLPPQFVLESLRGEVVILGTQYAGEMKRPGLHH